MYSPWHPHCTTGPRVCAQAAGCWPRILEEQHSASELAGQLVSTYDPQLSPGSAECCTKHEHAGRNPSLLRRARFHPPRRSPPKERRGRRVDVNAATPIHRQTPGSRPGCLGSEPGSHGVPFFFAFVVVGPAALPHALFRAVLRCFVVKMSMSFRD
jgi:hypothetical protein